jgi:hypothetical protein
MRFSMLVSWLPQAHEADDAFVVLKESHGVVDDVVEVPDTLVLRAQVRVGASRIPLALHQVEPVAEDEHGRAVFLGLVQVPAQHIAVALDGVEVHVRDEQHALTAADTDAVHRAADLLNSNAR